VSQITPNPIRLLLALLLAAVVLITGLPAPSMIAAPPLQIDETVDDRSIVVLEEGTDPVAAAESLGVTPVEVYRDVITGFAADLTPSAAAAVGRSRLVRQVAPDGRVQAEAQQTPTGVARVGTPLDSPASPRRIAADVAVVDSGVARHRDLNVGGGVACNGQDPYNDQSGHGTSVAGVIGALDNSRDVVGVAPGARIWAVKVLDASGSGRWSEVLCGLDWVYRNRQTIDVVNMSLSGAGEDGRCSSFPVHRAVCKLVRARIPVVVAAGNQGRDAATRIPAAWDEVITVSAFADSDGEPGGTGRETCDRDADDTWWYASNFGEDIDIAAPGSCILSLTPGGSPRRSSGTSLAAPHVAGAVARYKAERPNASEGKVRAWLLSDKASREQSEPEGFDPSTDPDRRFAERVLWLGGPVRQASSEPSNAESG